MHVERSQAGDAHGWEDDSRVADPDISPGDFSRAGRGNSPVGASRPDGPGSVGPVSAQ